MPSEDALNKPAVGPPLGRTLNRIAAVVGSVLAAGIVAEATISWVQSRRRPLPGRLVDIGGRKLLLRIRGEGAGPTVIFEAGLGGSSVLWSLVQDEVARFARTCSYDRGGYGYSDFGRLPRAGAQLAAELHLALTHAALPPPYILVAHSYGGLIARLFTSRNPHEVAGIVFVDALHGAIYDEAHVVMQQMTKMFGFTLGALTLLGAVGALRLIAHVHGPEAVLGMRAMPPAVRRELAASLPRDVIAALLELFFWDATLDEAEAAQLPAELPIIALTHDNADTFAAAGRYATRYERLWQDIQHDALRLSRRTRLLQAQHSGHHIALDDPADVVNAVRAIALM